MGAADIVPGVSGGTVALVLGHYQRLVGAISRVDSTLIGLVMRRDMVRAFQHVDGRFLFALGFGIALGIVSLAGAMHYLLDHHLAATMGLFLGLVLASVFVVRREVSRWDLEAILCCVVGGLTAAGITALTPQQASLSLPYLFLSASIAICAMILPGISGAFIMLLLGVYHPVTGLIKNAAKGEINGESALQIVVFSAGCLFGLLAFSRLLKHLLATHRDKTMAVLVGLMIGSVAKLWPFQRATAETASLEFKYREFVYVSPSEFGSTNILILLACLCGVVAVIAGERLAKHRSAA